LKNFKTRDITILAVLTAVLFAQELALSFLPNIQLTVLLIMLYSRVLGTKKSLIVVFVHVLLDNLIFGFNILYFISMLIGWSVIPLSINSVFKRIENVYLLGLLGILYSIIYVLPFMAVNVLILKVDFYAYLIADIPFTAVLAISSFLSIIWAYKPLEESILKFNQIYELNN
jgi:energy-coupling factor transport system substrate-specific component